MCTIELASIHIAVIVKSRKWTKKIAVWCRVKAVWSLFVVWFFCEESEVRAANGDVVNIVEWFRFSQMRTLLVLTFHHISSRSPSSGLRKGVGRWIAPSLWFSHSVFYSQLKSLMLIFLHRIFFEDSHLIFPMNFGADVICFWSGEGAEQFSGIPTRCWGVYRSSIRRLWSGVNVSRLPWTSSIGYQEGTEWSSSILPIFEVISFRRKCDVVLFTSLWLF